MTIKNHTKYKNKTRLLLPTAHFLFLFSGEIKIVISWKDDCHVCVEICVSTLKLLVHQVHFICEQSILTSLAASGALVTMESRHHTLLPRKKKFLIKSNP